MKTNSLELESSLNDHLHPTNAECHVVLLYDDYESGWQAMQLYENIVKNQCGDRLANWNRWRFADLYCPEAREAAVESLQEADILIVAAAETTELTVEAQAALETGVSLDRKRDRAFITLLGLHAGHQKGSAPLHFYLEDLALRNGFALFEATFALPEEEEYSPESIRERAETRGVVLTTILNRQIPLHWGINE